MSQVARQKGIELEIRDISDYVAEAMGIQLSKEVSL
jgi:hypothetical protein